MIPTSQLSLNDLKKRRTGLGDAQIFILDTLLAIKPFRPDPELGHLFPECISQIEVVEERRVQQVLKSS